MTLHNFFTGKISPWRDRESRDGPSVFEGRDWDTTDLKISRKESFVITMETYTNSKTWKTLDRDYGGRDQTFENRTTEGVTI